MSWLLSMCCLLSVYRLLLVLVLLSVLGLLSECCLLSMCRLRSELGLPSALGLLSVSCLLSASCLLSVLDQPSVCCLLSTLGLLSVLGRLCTGLLPACRLSLPVSKYLASMYPPSLGRRRPAGGLHLAGWEPATELLLRAAEGMNWWQVGPQEPAHDAEMHGLGQNMAP